MRGIRWQSLFRIIIALACFVVLGLTAANAKSVEPPLPTLIATQQVALWRCQDALQIPRTHPSQTPWSLPKNRHYRGQVLKLWTKRYNSCAAALTERKRQWNWQAWLPPVWRAIGMCETQLNWQHNSGTYQGAFGFYHGSWDAFRPPGYPSEAYLASPWQQYQVALRIHARYGFTGWGCWTNGGYRYHL